MTIYQGTEYKGPPSTVETSQACLWGPEARDVKVAHITQYCADRLNAGATPSTVQKEISCLRRMFNIALKEELLDAVPSFPQVEVDGLNARQGFFTDEAFYAVRAVLPSHLQVLVTVAFWVGARKKELLALQWRHLDLKTGKVELPAGFFKNKEARSFICLPRR